MKNYDYTKLIEDATFDVKYYEDQYNKAESNLFRARLALEALEIRQAEQAEPVIETS
jgi:hypothetical protein|tara:strand:+ start:235 stop:405 length:171 start_codon:yes stop_codon:yes gene_type:complete